MSMVLGRCSHTTSSMPRPKVPVQLLLRRVPGLGRVISEHGVLVNPRKVAVVAEWVTQQQCTDVLLFVSLANYYCKYVLRFSTLFSTEQW